jgi:hypothetical protein
MSKYWVIAPYDSTVPEIFDKVWEYDLQNETIALGWVELGDISRLSRSELKAKYVEAYGNSIAKSVVTKDTNALWAFYHEVSPGDVIIARRGTKKIIGIGTVTGVPFYDAEKGRERVANLTDNAYPNFIPVKWNEKEIAFDKIVFSFYTIYGIPEEKYRSLIEGNLPPSESDDEEIGIIQQPVEFVLEKYLEDFIVANFESIFKGRLELYKDPEGNIGQQYPAINDSGKLLGRIDILAKDLGTNSYLVIELKKGRESDKVVGQTLRYMGWVKETLCHGDEDVKGLIICKDADERLIYALEMVRDIIQVKLYSVNFQLADIN